mgnify:CR=1 FL=1|jgi:site-specific DNA recombinase
MNIAAIYCRLSDEDRNKSSKTEDSESIQNQKKLLLEFARENKWEVYRIYCDDDYSGLDSERPEFNQLISDAKAGKFNIILCKSQSRFTRDMEMVEKYLHNKFVEWGIRFVGLTDNADTLEKGNKKSRQINGLVNEWYCEDISENIKAVFEVKRKRGEFIGSFAPYGYKKDPQNKNKFLLDLEAAQIVKMIFSWYLEGYGVQHIAFMLNQKGIPNPTKYKELSGLKYKNTFKTDEYGLWNKTTIRRILRNEIYIGHMIQGKRKKVSYKSKKIIANSSDKWVKVENTHQPIVDNDTFLAVQRRINGKVKSTGNGKTHLFASKVKCKDCGSTMLKVTTGKYSYLRCKLYSVSAGNQMCTSHLIRLDELTDLIKDKIKEYFNRYIDVHRVVERLEKEQQTSQSHSIHNNELEKIKNNILEKKRIIKSLYVDKIKGIIDEGQFIEFNKDFSEEIGRLLERQKIVKKEMESHKNDKDNYEERVKNYLNFDKLEQNVVNSMIDHIEIGEKTSKGQKVKIYWQF